MLNKRLNMAVTLIGNPETNPGAKIKYGILINSLRNYFSIEHIFDGTLQGKNKWVNALQTFHPSTQKWKERFYKNVPAFEKRSQQVQNHLSNKNVYQYDLVFQINVLFNSHKTGTTKPLYIYTDYTARLSALKPESGRSPFTSTQWKKWFLLEQESFHAAEHVFTRGEFVREDIIANYQIDPEKVTSVGGGVNFNNLPEFKRTFNKKSPTLLFIGKDFYRKGGDILLTAFRNIKAKYPSSKLIMVTEPDHHFMDVEGIELIKPTWNRSVIQNLYENSDIFILPSRLETWGDVLLEAMSYGLPCIGVNSDAMNEIINDRQNGLLVSPDNPEELSNVIDLLLSDVDLAKNLGNQARKTVENKYTWSKIAADMSIKINETYLCQPGGE
jgi:glycosyltransferase involved in cell wall biosynthesis